MRKNISLLLLFWASLHAMDKHRDDVPRVGDKNLFCVATGYLMKALICQLQIKDMKNTPLGLVKGIMTFLEAEGALADGDEKLYEKLIKASAVESIPTANKELSEIYFKKAKNLLALAGKKGDKRAERIRTVISQYDLTKLLLVKLPQESTISEPPVGMYN